MKTVTEPNRMASLLETEHLIYQVVSMGFPKIRLNLADGRVVCGIYLETKSWPAAIVGNGHIGHGFVVTIQPDDSDYALSIDVEDIASIEGVR